MTPITVLILTLLIAGGGYCLHKWERKREATRTDDDLQRFIDYLRQSPDHELPATDAAYVENELFTATIKGQFDKRLAPVNRRINRITNGFFIRALLIEQVDRFMKNKPGQSLPPELLLVAQEEKLFLPGGQATKKETDEKSPSVQT